MVKVKICGLTNVDDALAAVKYGADLLGFVFFAGSPRHITPKGVRDIVAAISRSPLAISQRPAFVGVFVNEALERVQEIMAFCGLDYAQLHGHESPAYVQALYPDVIKAFRVRDRASLDLISRYQTPLYLLDAYHPKQMGGTGRAFEWELAREVAQKHSVILAGGLTPENVARAIRKVQPWGVDVSSGVEASPGKKDHQRLRLFIETAKGA